MNAPKGSIADVCGDKEVMEETVSVPKSVLQDVMRYSLDATTIQFNSNMTIEQCKLSAYDQQTVNMMLIRHSLSEYI